MKLLEIKNLTTEFKTGQGIVKAVRNVNYSLEKGEILGIVGESGSGKSVGMLSLMGLLADNGRIVSGSIIFDGEEISPISEKYKNNKKAYEKIMQEIRGNDIGMIFQDPMTFLNPILKVGTQIEEQILRHTKCSKKEARERAIELMKKVGIPSPEKRIDQYPFQFSGGMRQRIIIAIALSCNPKLIIADEPTTALDVTVQSQILELLQQIAEETGTAIIMITHDLGVVATLCQKINIMYGGQIVEHGTTDEIFYNPKHPYTMGLLRSIGTHTNGERQSLIPIPGTPPDLLKLNSGCAFMPRCSKAMKICKDYMPCRTQFSEDQYCSCWEYCKDSADKIVQEQSAAVNG